MHLERTIEVSHTKPKKATLFCVHGAAVGAWSFGLFPEYAVRAGYDVVTIDLRGHGQSEGKETIDSWTLSDYATDVQSVLATIDGPVGIVAHSMGGAVLQLALSALPAHVTALVLLSSPPPFGIPPLSPLGLYYTNQMALMRQVKKEKPGHALSLMIGHYMFSDRLDPLVVSQLRQRFDKESSAASKALLKPFSDTSPRRDIKIHVIGASGDRLITPDDLKTTAHHYQTTPLILEGLSHFMMLDPDWVLAAEAIIAIFDHAYAIPIGETP